METNTKQLARTAMASLRIIHLHTSEGRPTARRGWCRDTPIYKESQLGAARRIAPARTDPGPSSIFEIFHSTPLRNCDRGRATLRLPSRPGSFGIAVTSKGAAMYRSVGILVLAFLSLDSSSAWRQGTSSATIVGVVTDTSGAVLPGVTVEAASPVLIEKVRSAVTDERGEYRIVELIPGTYTVTFSLPGFSSLRREGIELPPSFNATVNVQLRIGAIEETVTVSGASPLVDTQTVTRQTVLPKALLDAVPSAKTLLSFYALTPALQSPTNAQDVGGSKGETSSRASLHGSKQGDTKMLLAGMSFNWFEGEGSGRTFFVNALTAQEIVVDTPTGSTSAEYTSNGVVLNVIPREGGNRFSGTLFASGTNHNLQADNMSDTLRAAGAITNSGTRSVYDVNAVLAGPILRNK